MTTKDKTSDTTQKLCAFGCGKKVHQGKRLCRGHLEHQRHKMSEYRSERKKLGLCWRCGEPARMLPDGRISSLCQKHRDHARKLEQKAVKKAS